VAVTSRSFYRIGVTGNNRFYRFLLNVCELVHGSWLASEEEGRYRFRDFLRDDKRMAYVFQYFIFNFLRIERRDLTVFCLRAPFPRYRSLGISFHLGHRSLEQEVPV